MWSDGPIFCLELDSWGGFNWIGSESAVVIMQWDVHLLRLHAKGPVAKKSMKSSIHLDWLGRWPLVYIVIYLIVGLVMARFAVKWWVWHFQSSKPLLKWKTGLAPEDRTGPVINDHRRRPVALGRLCGKPHEAEVSLVSEKSGLEIGQFSESAVEKIWEFSQFCEWL